MAQRAPSARSTSVPTVLEVAVTYTTVMSGGGDEGGGGGPSRNAAEVPVDDKGVPKNLGAYD